MQSSKLMIYFDNQKTCPFCGQDSLVKNGNQARVKDINIDEDKYYQLYSFRCTNCNEESFGLWDIETNKIYAVDKETFIDKFMNEFAVDR